MLVQRMKQSFALVEATVKAHPCLKLDFQVFLRSDGSVFNIDLDRCFKKERSKTAGPIEDEISPLDIIKLPEPSRRDWSPQGDNRGDNSSADEVLSNAFSSRRSIIFSGVSTGKHSELFVSTPPACGRGVVYSPGACGCTPISEVYPPLLRLHTLPWSRSAVKYFKRPKMVKRSAQRE